MVEERGGEARQATVEKVGLQPQGRRLANDTIFFHCFDLLSPSDFVVYSQCFMLLD